VVVSRRVRAASSSLGRHEPVKPSSVEAAAAETAQWVQNPDNEFARDVWRWSETSTSGLEWRIALAGAGSVRPPSTMVVASVKTGTAPQPAGAEVADSRSQHRRIGHGN
jgi:hypothetical protein